VAAPRRRVATSNAKSLCAGSIDRQDGAALNRYDATMDRARLTPVKSSNAATTAPAVTSPPSRGDVVEPDSGSAAANAPATLAAQPKISL